MSFMINTWRWAVEANKPVNFSGRNWNETNTLTSSVDVIDF